MLKDLISLANDLDKKGLRKEADYLDRIIKRYAEEGEISKYHPGRQFVLTKINMRSDNSKEPRETGGNPDNPINMFAFVSSEDTLIEGGILGGLIEDNAKKLIFKNLGAGSDEERREELESLYPGITSPEGHFYQKKHQDDGEYDRVYKLKCEGDCSELILIFDSVFWMSA